MTVSCAYCKQEWKRDPALDVPCPTCNVPIGKKCVRPSEHTVWGGQPHMSRDKAAMLTGILQKCSKAPKNASPSIEIPIGQLTLKLY